MKEKELFAAYRRDDMYGAECQCGGYIESRLGTEAAIRNALALHYESAPHQQWSDWQKAVHALQRPTRKPCPCHNHGAA